jgi:hypothetical protein
MSDIKINRPVQSSPAKYNGVIKTIIVTVLLAGVIGLSGWTLATANENSKDIASIKTWGRLTEAVEQELKNKDVELSSDIRDLQIILAADEPPAWFDRWFKEDWNELKGKVEKISEKADLIREEQIKNSARLDAMDKNN